MENRSYIGVILQAIPMAKNKSSVVKLKQEVTADRTLMMRAELIICHPLFQLIL